MRGQCWDLPDNRVKRSINMADGKSSEVLRQGNTEFRSKKWKKGITGYKRAVWLGNILTNLGIMRL